VESTFRATTTRVNSRRVPRKRSNHTERGTSAEVNESNSLNDEQPTTVPNDTPLPNGHPADVLGSASHESGTIRQGEGQLPRSPMADRSPSMAPVVRTRSTGTVVGTDRNEDDIVETHHTNGRLEGPRTPRIR